ncbi:MAG: efflux RND transporter periplasmic adaptor subunit [Lachnospiraceae bacterium]|nr:efflux RND transporter periplasmic adaptor subunit [Lachnospiraceae bacterium]
MPITNLKKRSLPGLVLTLALIPAVWGCGKKEEEAPPLVLESGDEAAEYSLTECMRGDLEETVSLTCYYRKNAEQEVYFPVSGKQIRKIYVQEGDIVKKGDLLAELAVGNIEDQIDELQYRIRRNELLLAYVDEDEALEIEGRYNNLAYMSGHTDEDKEAYDAELVKLKARNEQRRNSYRDSIEFDKKKLASLQGQLSQSRVYAQFDGKVSKVEKGLIGTTSNVEKCVMTVVDDQEGYFVSEKEELLPYLTEESYSMNVMFGNGRGDYELVPRDRESWGEKQYFSIKKGDNIEGLEVDDKGDIRVITARKEDTLYLPSECIRNAGDRNYVYVVTEEGLRDVIWVEVGLHGEGVTEILSGLKEGDKVIRRG